MEAIVRIRDAYIKLDSFLKFSGAVETGGQAKAAIQSGLVVLNGAVCLMRGKKIRNGDIIAYNGNTYVCKEASA